MIWIFVRHAHRDVSDRARDNGLSKKGVEQARCLAKYYKHWARGFENQKVDFWTSPAKRCRETLSSIAEQADAKPHVIEELGERGASESESAFAKRVAGFLADRTKSAGKARAHVVCSHGDWIPVAIEQLSGARVDVKKGSWIELEDGQLIRVLTPDDLAS